MTIAPFTGCGTALVTPFLSDGSLDEKSLTALVKRQIDAGINFLVPAGTTGESPTLNHVEHGRVTELTVVAAKGSGVPILAGAGGPCTADVVALAREMERLGADGILSVTPYYNRPNQEGVYQHYKAVAEAVSIPVVLYSIQYRTAVNIEPATVRRLAEIPNIVGIKEASGNISQMATVTHIVPEDFTVLAGDDAVCLPLSALGGRGVISVAANEVPAEMTALAQAAIGGRMDEARALQRRLFPLLEANFIEPNPIPVKTALAMLALCQPVWRLPLVPPTPATEARIRSILLELGLLE